MAGTYLTLTYHVPKTNNLVARRNRGRGGGKGRGTGWPRPYKTAGGCGGMAESGVKWARCNLGRGALKQLCTHNSQWFTPLQPNEQDSIAFRRHALVFRARRGFAWVVGSGRQLCLKMPSEQTGASHRRLNMSLQQRGFMCGKLCPLLLATADPRSGRCHTIVYIRSVPSTVWWVCRQTCGHCKDGDVPVMDA